MAENQPGSGPKNRVNHSSSFPDYAVRLRMAIGLASPSQPNVGFGEREFNQWALELFALQFAQNPVYRRFCAARGVTPVGLADWRQIPTISVSAFKEVDLTSLPEGDRICVFHSSGTTGQRPSRHFHDADSLAVYEASLQGWFAPHLLPEGAARTGRVRMLSLTPTPEAAPHSSLVHMLATVGQGGRVEFLGEAGGENGWSLDGAKVLAAVEAGAATGPVMLLGTAFNFVHWLDFLTERGVRLELPAGSRIMETGGYKGRSRIVPKEDLHDWMTQRLGVGPESIICEYGMSELSSQGYDGVAGRAQSRRRRFAFPPWARVQVVSPETGREVAEGETGLLRIYDLANLRSVLAVQTEDLGVRRGEEFELLGRAELAEPRGCSLQSA